MSEILQLMIDRLETPIGEMVIVADHEGNLRVVDWTDHEARMRRFLRIHYGENRFKLEPVKNPCGFVEKINRYFAGELRVLDTLPVATNGTPFQRAVWRALRTIPCGTTITYGKLAEQIGKPTAVRAVGLANGSNPIGVIVPCHRVIGANGSLTGYGGGLERKRWLLQHESAGSISRDPVRAWFDHHAEMLP
ncbi:MAG: methylated-DNA--[protein]-cysteine S-methyltransferase [Candidatus Sulfotelmatobacter sp.]